MKSWSKDKPRGVKAYKGEGSARRSYAVLRRDNDPPRRRDVPMGAVTADAGFDLDFRPARDPYLPRPLSDKERMRRLVAEYGLMDPAPKRR